MEIVCGRCGEAKPSSEFKMLTSRQRGYKPVCYPCQWATKSVLSQRVKKKYDREGPYNHRGERERPRKEMIHKLKDVPCTDCGVKFHFSAMDFDHLPGHEKKFEISKAHLKTELAIEAELKKCEVVCSNCHRLRTYKRRYGKLV